MKQPIITNQITALYERLSRDDELSGDSVSIQTQKFFLEDYAKQHGFVPFVHYTDDGFSGGNFNRPSWNRLVADVEAGKVSAVIVKDMSRVGREYLQTGYYTEIFFPQNHVRFIAVSNNIDSNDRNNRNDHNDSNIDDKLGFPDGYRQPRPQLCRARDRSDRL